MSKHEAHAAAAAQMRHDRRFLWFWLFVATAFSVGGNVGHAALSTPPGPTRAMAIAWAATPPLLLMLAIHGLPVLARMVGNADRDRLLTLVVWGVTVGAFGWSATGLWEFTVAMGVPPRIAVLAPFVIDLSVFGATRGLVVTAPTAARMKMADAPSIAPPRAASPTRGASPAPIRREPDAPVRRVANTPSTASSPEPVHREPIQSIEPEESITELAESIVHAGLVNKSVNDVAQVLTLAAAGESGRSIAAQLSIDPRTVGKIVKAASLPTPEPVLAGV
jgi:hypothetical protein